MLGKYILSKANGHENPQIGHKVINFIVVLSIYDKKAFDFVSANVQSVEHQWIEQIAATRCIP